MRLRAMVAVVGLMGALLAVAAAPAGGQSPPTCNGRTATIWGDDGNNRIIGTDGPDVIHGLGGRDRIFGGGGADVICGGDGSDLIKGQKGRDTIFGDDGRDRLIGGQGDDIIEGGRGNDSVRGGFGDDTLIAGPGSDLVRGGGGIDDCTFDRNDAVEECEEGDIRGFTSFGDATVPVDVATDFAFSTFSRNGFDQKAYIVEIFVQVAEPTIYTLSVLDRFGNTMGGDTRFISDSIFDSLVLVSSEPPATLQVTGLGGADFWDIGFVRPKTAQQVTPAGTFTGFDSWVWKWQGGVPSGQTLSLTYGPSFKDESVSGFVVGYSPAGVPTLLFEMTNVTEETTFTVAPPAGETFYFIYAPDADWVFEFLPNA